VSAVLGKSSPIRAISAASSVRWPQAPYDWPVVPTLVGSPNGADVDAHTEISLDTASYRELETRLDRASGTLWCFMRPDGLPSFTRTLLRELIALRSSIQHLFAGRDVSEDAQIRYFVGGSRLPHIYNLGVTSASSLNASAPGTRTPCAATRTTASTSVITCRSASMFR
jgi:hypothetical protein